jgi:hypothetical protein
MVVKHERKLLPKGYDAYKVLHQIDAELANTLESLTQMDTGNGVSEALTNFNRHLITETVKYFNTREDNSK